MDEFRIYIIGAGGHGTVVAEVLGLMGLQVSGFVDSARAAGSEVSGLPIVGDDTWLLEQAPRAIRLVNGIGVRADTTRRAAVFEHWTGKGFRFTEIRHPSAVVSASSRSAGSAQIMAGAIVQPGTRLGHNTVVNTGASIDHDCDLEDHVFVSPGTTICGSVFIGEGSFIGAGAVILPGTRIERGAVVGGGTIVKGKVEACSKVVGNPARSIGGMR